MYTHPVVFLKIPPGGGGIRQMTGPGRDSVRDVEAPRPLASRAGPCECVKLEVLHGTNFCQMRSWPVDCTISCSS